MYFALVDFDEASDVFTYVCHVGCCNMTVTTRSWTLPN